MSKYNQLSLTERVKIFEYLKMSLSIRTIAALLGRAVSTVAREIKKNSDYFGYLYPQYAHEKSKKRRARHLTKIDKFPELKNYIVEKLNQYWSPCAIAGRWTKEHSNLSICAETIYQYIYAPKNKYLALWTLLPQKKKKRGVVRKSRSKGKIKDRTSIHERPKAIDKRIDFGHFESDLFFNKGSQSANTLNSIERVSRKIFLKKNASKAAHEVTQSLKKIVVGIAKSNTMDNGSEFANHGELKNEGIATYFCDPGSPWQKGAVEQANKMIRRFIPFKLNFKEITQKKLDTVAEIINNTPRKSLNFSTPNEVFSHFYQKKLSVALQN